MINLRIPRCLFVAVVVLATSPVLAEDIETATRLRLQGRYAEAIEAYEACKSASPVDAALGMAACYTEQGAADKATEALTEVDARAEGYARVLAAQAEHAFNRGDYDQARQLVDTCLKRDAANVRAGWLDAELHRVTGALDEADAGYDRLTDAYNASRKVTDAEEIRIYGLAASRTARWNRRSEDFRVLVNDLLPSALQVNEHYWPAHVDAALLFIEKYNQTAAKTELDKARAINPHSADVLAAQALLMMQSMEFETVEKLIDRALEANPQHILALQLKSDLQLASFQTDAALETIESALAINPRDEASLGRKAATLGLLDGMADGPSERMQQVIDAATEANTHCGLFFEAIGDAFDLTRKYPPAAIYYEQAAQRMPQLIQVPGKLGMVQMRLGEEGRAGELLEKSFEFDPFNVRVKNTLEVLDLLQGYAVIETEHFVIKFDRGQEQVLAEAAAAYLEEDVYPEITKSLGFEPPEKSLFEIFSRGRNSSGHAWFSARMVGLPSIGTVGACAGKIVALASPNEMPQPYNWARVLKHEFVHVVNLQQTNFNIPHWYTEALAVLHERQPRPEQWNEILARRARADELYDLSNINLAFARPRNFENWTLAYCQAELYAEFMQQAYGEDALAKMLDAYADNLTTPVAVERCFGVKQAEFESDYRAYVDSIVAELPESRAVESTSFAELQRAVNENPEDAGALAKLARAHLARGAKPKARQSALAALKVDPEQQEAAYVLARLYLSIGEVKRAATLLRQRLDTDEPHADALALLAGLHLKAENFAEAGRFYELGRKRWPQQTRWLKALAKLYIEADQSKELADVLGQLVALDADNVTMTKKLADLAFKREDFAEAVRWANQSLHIDVKDANVHALLGQALAEQDAFTAAIRAFRTALQLNADEDAWRFMLADTHVQAKQLEEAKVVLEELLERAPNYPGAALLLESIQSE